LDKDLGTNYIYADKRWRVSADKIESRAKRLIRKGAAGVWLWNPEVNAANYKSLKKKTESQSFVGRSVARYSGWATQGPPGQSPPSKENLPISLINTITAYRWCRYKDRWLLFSLHKIWFFLLLL
jgi:hypothetical protein